MALVLDGNGTMTVGNGDITGITRGAIESTAIGAGAVLQVVQAVSTTATTISTTSETAVTGMSASITLSSTSSKVLIMITLGEFRVPIGDGARFQLYKNGSKIIDAINEASYSGLTPASQSLGLFLCWSYVDSPNNINPTYALFARQLLNGQAGSLEIMPNAASTSSIILMEIAA